MTNENHTTTEKIFADMLNDGYVDELKLSDTVANVRDWNFHIARSAISAKWTTKRLETFIISGRPILSMYTKDNGDFFSCSALRKKVGDDDDAYKMLNSITSMHRQWIEKLGIHPQRMTPYTDAELTAMAKAEQAAEELAAASDDAEQAIVDNGLTTEQTEIRLETALSDLDSLRKAILSMSTDGTKGQLVKRIESLQVMANC